MSSSSEIHPPQKKRGKRAERADEIRHALFDAAATAVGKYGYEEASIGKITELAGVASGTFYNYFETRQDLFDQLLPVVGDQLLEHIRARLPENVVGLERERQRIVAYFEFFRQNPGFLRILNEAEIFAPRAFKLHFKKFSARYMKALKGQMERGEIQAFNEAQLEALVHILMGARTYLTMLSSRSSVASRKKNDMVLIDTYMKLVEGGLFAPAKAATATH
ncbi:TetR/AcrR family transcriptional regulator [Noviherbaspirillum sedimenti]|uniref:TetR/AcrR family transcriptional regulator n=1 Tax=Noviherbaspirillum sedimenti TaxID=2320865 RepID=A0A3A3G542_9BURK|nr:TetR/AcrR family transcriptional regulator [Noviherbaspirillum sedimenti]RJG02944.1 TetR/AcrR family transcriptional regulator [Noviherbaspirillum sedimenti]